MSTPLPPAAQALLEAQALVHAAHQQHLAALTASHNAALRLLGAAPAALAAGLQRAAPQHLPAASQHPSAAPQQIAAPQHPPATPQHPPAPPQPPAETFPGPAFSRADLIGLATGRISDHFGPLFARQDGYARQVRMPAPPLLLADRVLGIDGPPGELRPARLWTETDVTWDAWYLHDGTMPPGIMIESGQADLLLVSWLGVDFLNQGERVYRLLGCSLSWHGPPPRPGETLRYEIHIDGFASHGDIRLFFFRYDCTVNGALRLRVRGGQAGFFTDQELAESEGVLWDPHEHTPDPALPRDPPPRATERTQFSRADLDAFAAGDLVTCFGPEFWPTQTHVHTPRIPGGRLLLPDRVTELSLTGGPWGRGYLRAEQDLSPDAWFFQGHFQGDPCMPGTLMFEGCVSTLTLVLAARGVTLDRDGWRFQTVRESTYTMRCRGQATPQSHLVVYEVFVVSFESGPIPRLIADVLVTVDGRAAFHCPRLGLELVPDWPLSRWPQLPADPSTRSLLASAIGRPSAAFGDPYTIFDGARRAPRLPGPPYHCVSRVVSVDAAQGSMAVGATVEMAWTPGPEAVALSESGPLAYALLAEAALQPCGWLASWLGCAVESADDVYFRNLDGDGAICAAVPEGELRTRATLTSLSRLGALTLVKFQVQTSCAGVEILRLSTGFGFFPAESLASQAGLPALPGVLDAPSDVVVALDGHPSQPRGALRVLDRVTGVWDGPGLGRVRAEMRVDPDAWYFKAHFFQDPVMPGSLGLEAMHQLLRFWMVHTEQVTRWSHFEAVSERQTWTYRGQVRPQNRLVVVVVDVTACADGHATADASLWVDGQRIYAATGIGVRAR